MFEYYYEFGGLFLLSVSENALKRVIGKDNIVYICICMHLKGCPNPATVALSEKSKLLNNAFEQ